MNPILTDGSNTFARHTVYVRLPGMIDRLLADNRGLQPHSVNALTGLREELLSDGPMHMFDRPAPDFDRWAAYLDDHEQRLGRTATWQHAEWFVMEHFFFRRIIAAVGYWETGLDPFLPAKTRELNAPQLMEQLDAVLTPLTEPTVTWNASPEDFTNRLTFALWGNQMDLTHTESMAHASVRHKSTRVDDNIIVDDTESVRRLALRASKPIHIVCDNAGTELAADLCLADWFISSQSLVVHLHVKEHPTFVSDATENDVSDLMGLLGTAGGPLSRRGFAGRLTSAMDSGRLVVTPDLFWNSPLYFESIPLQLHRAFSEAGMIFIKGDMNYRRLVSDNIVPAADPLSQWAVRLPAPTVMLRTMKSDPVAGVPAKRLAALEQEHPGWRTAGTHGVIQMLGAPDT